MSIAIVEDRASPHGIHCPLQLAADCGDEVPVLAVQDANGYVLTNRYVDGTRGVSDDDFVEAQLDENPWCACCHGLVSEWQHGTADDWAARHGQGMLR